MSHPTFRNRNELDQDTEKGIIEAYRETCGGNLADYVLCDPDLNAKFVFACENKGLRGDGFLWNRLLLRIRKAGKLPRVEKSLKRLSFRSMDEFSYASEIVMQLLNLDYGYPLDEVLCSPQAAAEFDRIARQFAPGFRSFEYRWAALAIRKRATQSRLLAKKQFLNWLKKSLPPAMPLTESINVKYGQPGVYILTNGNQYLYVGRYYISFSNSSSVITGTPNFRALSSLLPAFSPAMR